MPKVAAVWRICSVVEAAKPKAHKCRQGVLHIVGAGTQETAVRTPGATGASFENGSPPESTQVSSSSPTDTLSAGIRSGALTDFISGVRPLYTDRAKG